MSTNEAAERLRRMFSSFPEGEALNREMGWTLNGTLDDALAIEVEAAERSAGAAPLDVERLAKALKVELNRTHRAGEYRELAAAILARLAEGTDR